MARRHAATMTSPHVYRIRWQLWLALLLLTAALAYLAATLAPGPVLLVLALCGAWLKGTLVAEHYMGLRHAPRWLRAAVHGWLLLVCGGILLTFLPELP